MDFETLFSVGSYLGHQGTKFVELLARHQCQGSFPIMGVELDERAIIACVQQGFSVIQADLNADLAVFVMSR